MLGDMKGLALSKRTLAAAAAWLIFEVTVIELAIQNGPIASRLGAAGWQGAAGIALVSFALTAVVALAAEWTTRITRERKPRPDLDAYIDQMIAANGTHLNRD